MLAAEEYLQLAYHIFLLYLPYYWASEEDQNNPYNRK